MERAGGAVALRSRRGRAWAAVALVVVVALPLVGWPSRNSFPLSDYPMFASRGPRVVDLARVVGERADGTTVVLPPHRFGTNEVLTARAVITRAASDPAAAAELCAATAASVAGEGFVAVAVRIDRYDTVGYFTGDHSPVSGVEVHRCGAEP